jgi:hypothetical protein
VAQKHGHSEYATKGEKREQRRKKIKNGMKVSGKSVKLLKNIQDGFADGMNRGNR